jgi:Zn-dependent peptidase ImmA (M78 family)
MLEIRKIRQRVDALLRQNAISRPPVPVEKIADNLELEVRYAPYDGDLSGALVRSKGETYIGVNSSDHSNRQRFTIAHELGHFILHRGITIHVDKDFRVNLRDGDSSKGVDSNEMEANRFAAELLMPTRFLVKDIERLSGMNQAELNSLARRYKVSAHAMRIRLSNFGIFLPDWSTGLDTIRRGQQQ